MIANAEKLREALNEEKESEVRQKLSFISLVTGGMKLKEGSSLFRDRHCYFLDPSR